MTTDYLLLPFNKDKGDLFCQRLLTWFADYGRHDLPWKPQAQLTETTNLYRIWISEIMLQQTQVATVIPYFENFMLQFPTIEALANAPQDDVLKAWEGLGYYSRARNLHHTAKTIVKRHEGQVPASFDALIELKGIGKTTAAAILSQGYHLPYAILDGNVKRVLSRILGCEAPRNQLDRILQPYADNIASTDFPADYTQAIMDFGATICTRNPQCESCFFTDHCVGYQLNKTTVLPTPNPKKTKPTIISHFLIFTNQQRKILVVKRPKTGIWANLYSFPELEFEYNLDDWLNDNNLEVTTIERLSSFTHQFSHYTLQGYPTIIEITSEDIPLTLFPHSQFISLEAFHNLPKPKPIIDLLHALLPFSLEA